MLPLFPQFSLLRAFIMRVTSTLAVGALLTACATAPAPLQQGAWSDLPENEAPLDFTLPDKRMKIVRARRTQLNSDGDIMTETSFADRGREYPTVTFLLQTLQDAKTVFVSGSQHQTGMSDRVAAAVGDALIALDETGPVSNSSGPAEFLNFRTNRDESCVAVRQYRGDFKPGTVVDGKELLGSQVVLALYCTDQDEPVRMDRIQQILNGYTLKRE